MKDRIRLIMEDKHMTQQTFANFIGISAASLSSIFNNRTKPTMNIVEAIKAKIPEVSLDWLMLGLGSMYKDSQSMPSSVQRKNDVSVKEPTLDFGFGGPVLPHTTQQERKPTDTVPQDKPVQVVKPEIRYVERPRRQITEIRIFFDDGTYETFTPKK